MTNIPVPFGEQQYLNPQGGLELPIGGRTSKYPQTGDPRFDNLPEEQKDRVFKGMMGDLVPEGGLVDLDTGAPTGVRGKVGALQSPEDRMRAMRASFPEGDVQPYGEDNFLFTSPQTGMRTVFNPSGLDVGDFPGAAPEIAGAAGSTLGALAGVPGGPAGMIAGAGVGGQAAREATRYGIQSYTGEPDTRSTRDRLLSAGSEAAIDAAGQGLGMAVPGAARLAFGARASRNAPQLLQEFQQEEVPYTAAMITGNPALRGAEANVGTMMGGEPLERAVTGAQTRLQERVGQEAEGLAGGQVGTRAQTGREAQLGVDAAEQRFRDQQERLYTAAYNRVGRNTLVELRALGRLRTELAQEMLRGRAVNAPEIRSVIQRLDRLLAPQRNASGIPQAQPLPFEELRRERTKIGRTTKVAPVGRSESTTAEYTDRLYAALSEDMNQAARQAGGAAEIDAADAFTREFHAKQGPGPLLQDISKAKSPEHAFETVSRMKGSQLMQVRRQLGEREWNQFVATTLEDMGRALPGAQGAVGLGGAAGDFSVATFVKNWNKLQANPEVRQAMFGGRNYAALRTALDRLVNVSRAVDQTAPHILATSGSQTGMRQGTLKQLGGITAGLTAMGQGGWTGAAGAATAATLGFGPLLTARLMTNARFVNWLVGARNAASRQGVEGLAPWIGRLGAVAAAAPELKDDVEALMRAMTGRVLTTGRPKIENVSTGGIRG